VDLLPHQGFHTPPRMSHRYSEKQLPPSLREFYSPLHNEGNRVYENAQKAHRRVEESRGVMVYIVAWYGLSTVNNIVEKQVLQLADAPLGLGLSQMLGTSMISYRCMMVAAASESKGLRRQKVMDPDSILPVSMPMRARSLAALWRIVPIAGCVAGMRGLHNVALGVVSLKLLQTVKCTAPVLNVFMQKAMYGKSFSPQTYLALLIISIGIVLTCGTELELSALGVMTAVSSTFMQNLQTIFGKNLLDDNPDTRLDEMELQFWTCLMSAAIYFPIWCLTEGLNPISLAPGQTYLFLMAAGVFYFAQSWVALKVLSKLDGALSHTIASTFKRVVLIVFSAIWFGNQVSVLNALGIMMAMCGLAYYNYTKHMKISNTKAVKENMFQQKDISPAQSPV